MLSSEKQGAAKTSCQTGKEDKMVTIWQFSLLLRLQHTAEIKKMQEMLPRPIASQLLCYPSPHTACGEVQRQRSYLQWLGARYQWNSIWRTCPTVAHFHLTCVTL